MAFNISTVSCWNQPWAVTSWLNSSIPWARREPGTLSLGLAGAAPLVVPPPFSWFLDTPLAPRQTSGRPAAGGERYPTKFGNFPGSHWRFAMIFLRNQLKPISGVGFELSTSPVQSKIQFQPKILPRKCPKRSMYKIKQFFNVTFIDCSLQGCWLSRAYREAITITILFH